MEQETLDLKELKGSLSGTIVAAGEEGYDDARAAWNLTADQHPAAVAFVEGPDDIAATIAFARANGLGIAAQGTGHGAACRQPMEDSILLRTDRIRGVEVDPGSRVGRFEAGAIWRDAVNAAAEHGLAGYPGSSPDAGIVGYTTGGGFGWLARRYGLACNNVRAIELITADGEQRRIDAENDPDLFWAQRGGGGSFGVITAIEFDLAELPEVFAGSVIYPADDLSERIIKSWREWTGTIPDEITSTARFLHLPPLPQIPEPLRDRPLITIGACYAGSPAKGEELIAPMRELGAPVMDMFEAMPPSQLVSIAMDPEEPVPGLIHGSLLRELPGEALDAYIKTNGPDSGSPLLQAELRHAGGALEKPAEGGGALSHLDAAFTFSCVGVPMTPEIGKAILRHADAACEALEPWSTGATFFNFAERPTPLGQLFAPEVLERLRDVKRRYDPGNVIRGNHPIGVE